MLTFEPGLNLIDLILPETGDSIMFSIFIASNTTMPVPALTSSPSLTKKRITVPGIGALIAVSPAAIFLSEEDGLSGFEAEFFRGRARAT